MQMLSRLEGRWGVRGAIGFDVGRITVSGPEEFGKWGAIWNGKRGFRQAFGISLSCFFQADVLIEK